MLPQYFIEIDELPLTPNGKIDRKSLPSPFATGGNENEPEKVAPRKFAESKLLEIWAEALAPSEISIYDNFRL